MFAVISPPEGINELLEHFFQKEGMVIGYTFFFQNHMIKVSIWTDQWSYLQKYTYSLLFCTHWCMSWRTRVKVTQIIAGLGTFAPSQIRNRQHFLIHGYIAQILKWWRYFPQFIQTIPWVSMNQRLNVTPSLCKFDAISRLRFFQ